MIKEDNYLRFADFGYGYETFATWRRIRRTAALRRSVSQTPSEGREAEIFTDNRKKLPLPNTQRSIDINTVPGCSDLPALPIGDIPNISNRKHLFANATGAHYQQEFTVHNEDPLANTKSPSSNRFKMWM